MEDKNKTFSYTYSPKQREEIESIRQKYMPHEESTIDELRKLDESVTISGTIGAIIIGIISTLILGVGMCFVMVWKEYFILGVFIGILGLIGIGMAYPVFRIITKQQRKKIAPQIIKLTDELMRQK